MKFSLITPTHNRGYILWKTIQAIQRQEYPYFEHIIVDDGSTDNTKQVMAEFVDDPRITYVYTPHKNVSHARNTGMKHATGDVLTYIDSDDSIYPNYLSIIKTFLEKNPTKSYGIPNHNRRTELYDNEFHLLESTTYSSFQKEHISLQDIYHWHVKTTTTGLFHTRSAITASLQWDETIRSFQDWDFLMQLGNSNPEGFLHIPYVLFEYKERYNRDGICSQMTYGEWAKDFERMYQKHRQAKLLTGQTWYPDRIHKYTALQEQVEKGEIPPAMYKYFPNYWKK